MARISLLFTLTIVLAISSVLAHPPPTHKSSSKKFEKILCPPMLSGLQSFPHIQISKFLEKTAKSAPNTPQFQLFWAMCKSFDDQLSAFRLTSAKEVVRSAKANYDFVSKAFLEGQKFFGIGGASEFAVNLKANFEKMAKNYFNVVEKVGKFSAKYKFDVDAKISEVDRAEMDKCVIQFKGTIRVFLKMAMDKKMFVEKSFVMDPIGSFGVIAKKGLDFSSNVMGGFGAHGQAGAKAGAHAGAQAGGNFGGIFGFNAAAKAGAHAGSNVRGLFEFNSGAKAGAQAGGDAEVYEMANYAPKVRAEAEGYAVGTVVFNAAGKAKFVGGNVFKPLKSSQTKHLD